MKKNWRLVSMSPTAQIWHPRFYSTTPSTYMVLCHSYNPLHIKISPNVTAFPLPGHCVNTGLSSSVVWFWGSQGKQEIDTRNTFSLSKMEKGMNIKIQNATPISSLDTELEILCTPNPHRLLVSEQCQKLMKRNILFSCLWQHQLNLIIKRISSTPPYGKLLIN